MSIQEKDKQFVWHPFTHQLSAKPAINIVRGEGVYFFDDKGNKYIDAISSWWVNLHGHCNPYISKKVSEQLTILEHSIFSDFTHEPAVNLAERLLKKLPENQSKIFYSDNGSTAVSLSYKKWYVTVPAYAYASLVGYSRMRLGMHYGSDVLGGMIIGIGSGLLTWQLDKTFNKK